MVAHEAASGTGWRDKARDVEDLGYSTLVVPDHFGDNLSPFAAMTAAACATAHLRVGSMVLNNDLRRPGLVAQEAASIDLLSSGRLEFGLGAGYMKEEYEALGIDFDPGRDRLARLEDSVRTIKALLSGPSEPDGDVATIPACVQEPHPPILIGGGGPAILRLAAREADIVGIIARARADGGGIDDADFSLSSLERKVDIVRREASRAGTSPEISALIQRVVIDDRDRARRQIAREWNWTAEQVEACPYLLLGSADEVARAVRTFQERFGISYLCIFERDSRELGPLIGRI
ncbi:MAG: TIGR03621 family F420-dependent LLM class oxidoreductase [Actinomycetota bacterium]